MDCGKLAVLPLADVKVNSAAACRILECQDGLHILDIIIGMYLEFKKAFKLAVLVLGQIRCAVQGVTVEIKRYVSQNIQPYHVPGASGQIVGIQIQIILESDCNILRSHRGHIIFVCFVESVFQLTPAGDVNDLFILVIYEHRFFDNA